MSNEGYFKALTLKVSKPRYDALRRMGLESGKTNQQLLTEALDEYMFKHALEADAAQQQLPIPSITMRAAPSEPSEPSVVLTHRKR